MFPSEDVHEPKPVKPSSRVDFVRKIEPLQADKRRRRRRAALLIILVVLAGGGAAFWRRTDQADYQRVAVVSRPHSKPQSPSIAPARLQSHNSEAFGVTLRYPGDWQVREEATELTVRSPISRFTGVNGKSVRGQVVFGVVTSGSYVTDFEVGAMYALNDSLHMEYANPSPTQRQHTYVSFTSVTGKGLDAIYVTGDNGYLAGATITNDAIAPLQPLVRVRFFACDEEPCNTSESGERVRLAGDEWQTNPLLRRTHQMLETLKIN